MGKSARNANSVNRLDALTVATVAEAKALGVPIGTVVETQGYYSSGDGGANRYVVVAGGTGTDDGGSFIDMDNGNQARGLFPNNQVFPEQFGADSSAADNYLSLQNSVNAAVGKEWVISKEFKTSKGITVPDGVTINALNGAWINGDSINDIADAPDGSVLFFGGSDLVQIPNLSAAAVKGENTVSFSAEHGLSEGDIFCIWNPTDFSFSPFRSYYHQGQWCKVATVVSNTQVLIDTPLYETFQAADVKVYTANFPTPAIKGKLKVTCSSPSFQLRSIYFLRCKDFDVSAVDALADNSYGALVLDQCYNVTGDGAVAIQKNITGSGTDYGLAVVNSQHLDIEGYFVGARRGVSHGGSAGAGGVPCRDSNIKGVISTTNEGLVFAADFHGNCEYCSFDGVINGGATIRGKNNKIKGKLKANIRGIALSFSELANYNHDLSGVEFIGNETDPFQFSGRGLVDLGGGSVSDDALTESGVLNFSGATFDGPNATKVLVARLRENQSTGAEISLKNAKVKSFKSGSNKPVLIESVVGTVGWSQVILLGLGVDINSRVEVNSANRVAASIQGVEPVSFASGDAIATSSISFPFDFGVTPNVQVSYSGGFVGTIYPVCGHSSTSSFGFDAVLATADASTPFPASNTRDVYWSVIVDEI